MLQDAHENCHCLLGFNYEIRLNTFKSLDTPNNKIAYRSALMTEC